MLIRHVFPFVASLALTVISTVAHAGVTEVVILNAPRHVSILALLPSPALPVSAPLAVEPELAAQPTPAPVEAPVEPSPDQSWASAMRAFGHR